jgi:hypothetical protein
VGKQPPPGKPLAQGRARHVRGSGIRAAAFQFDWSGTRAIIGNERTLQVARTKLSYSRAFIVRAYLLQTHEMLFDASRPIAKAHRWMARAAMAEARTPALFRSLLLFRQNGRGAN